MFRKKSFYFLVVLLIMTLVLAGCGGGSDSPPGTDDGDDNETKTETVSLSGEFSFPETTTAAVSSLNNDEYEIIVENFETGNLIENIDITFTESNRYQVSGIETGQDIVITIIKKSDDDTQISTFIPEITKEDENDETVGNTDSATTVLTAIAKKQKMNNNEIIKDRDELKTIKTELEEHSNNLTSSELKNIVKDIEEDRIDSSEDVGQTITEVTEKIEAGVKKENAEEMVEFVRNSGLFVENSATTHEKIVKKNVETLSSGLENFSTDFETEMRYLFTDDFALRLPNNYDKTPQDYDIENLSETEDEFTKELFEMDRWEWTLKSGEGEDEVIISTDFPSLVTNTDETKEVDLSEAEFNYVINGENESKFFIGNFSLASTETEVIPVNEEGKKIFDLIVPVNGDMKIDGQYKTSKMEETADLNITLDETADLNDNSAVQNITLEGDIRIPEFFAFDGTIDYESSATYNSDYIIQDLEYIEVLSSGNFETLSTEVEKNIIIEAHNLDFRIEGNEVELKYFDINGLITDSSEKVKWDGEMSINFENYTDKFDNRELLIDDLFFKGSVSSDGKAPLTLEIDSNFEYELNKVISGESTIYLARESKYLDGNISADSEETKVVLENENHSKFYLNELDSEINADKSFIKNSKGEIIAEIDADGRIYYLDDENGGRIGSIY
ncbi:MAG: hypothetical protein ACOCV1_07570 [Bacillota bacterium]